MNKKFGIALVALALLGTVSQLSVWAAQTQSAVLCSYRAGQFTKAVELGTVKDRDVASRLFHSQCERIGRRDVSGFEDACTEILAFKATSVVQNRVPVDTRNQVLRFVEDTGCE
jgi:hypothetical protein